MMSGHPVAWCDEPTAHLALTARQQAVACHLIQGLPVREIADRLTMATGTARMHIKHLHARTGTRTLHALALWCWSHRECCIHCEGATELHRSDI
ncbi:MAG: hypothetical protein GEU80_09400 [Dehalococcoidia bacterium]|nr:hypothetical protein [Dehalococcoidia bacterium]